MKRELPLINPTLLDVAKAAGVSRTTASNAFNRPDQLSTKRREWVLSVARDMGYAGPNPMARMLRTGRAGVIGVVFPETLTYAVTDPAAVALLQGVAKGCEREGTGMLILSATDEQSAQQTVAKAAVDGFIINCLVAEKAVIQSVLAQGQPVVALDHDGSIGASSIDIEERAGAFQAAEHIAKLGHRRIAILSLDTRPDDYQGPLDRERRSQAIYQTTMERLAGYEEALRANGLETDTLMIEETPCGDREAAFQATIRLLSLTTPPTAILAMSDVMALAAVDAARELGFLVPRDLSVVGFDDVPIAAQVQPALTTVHQPLLEKGELAVKLLFDRTGETARHLLPTRLILRGTTAPPS